MFLIKILIGVLVAIEVYERWIEPKLHPEPEPEPVDTSPAPPRPEEVAREAQRLIANFCERRGLRWTFLEEPDPQAPAWPGFAVRITDGHEATAFKIVDATLVCTSPELIMLQATKYWWQKGLTEKVSRDEAMVVARAVAGSKMTPNDGRELLGLERI